MALNNISILYYSYGGQKFEMGLSGLKSSEGRIALFGGRWAYIGYGFLEESGVCVGGGVGCIYE